MRLPSACYRLQFRSGMDFDAAAALVPYLASLGISHLYAAPVFTARRGSAHGYDVTDPTAVDPALGGRAGLMRLSAALDRAGMGLILDIVPNHLAFSVETPWLRDLLRHGRQSRYLRHFALDDDAGRLRLPWLPAPFAHLCAQGSLRVAEDGDGPVLAAGALRVPLAATPGLAAARTGSRRAIAALHAEQPWRLVHWRREGDAITHRRFFNVTGLIGLRVERPEVFEDSHRLIFDLVETGVVHGLRVDHVDGLIDPAAYLARLRARLPAVPVWVEKILAPDESLPRDWPVQGTTGYVAARAFTRLLTSGEGAARIGAAYRRATGRTDPPEEVVIRARRQVMTQDLAAELWLLHRHLTEIAAADPVGVEFGPEDLREALLALISVFPRYRTYATAARVPPDSAAIVHRAAQAAADRVMHPAAVAFLAAVLIRPEGATAEFRLRFQQVTGAAVAKSVEDTAFYREVRLISANEVGSHPDDPVLDVAGFHREMARRAAAMPLGLTLTSSHDTKRSEDARMRIVALSHLPATFLSWHRICRRMAADRLDANLVWYLAQSVLALDPEDGDLPGRLARHVVKAMREARRDTFWTAPDRALEAAAQDLARDLAGRFVAMADGLRPILAAADRLSLAQAALKLTVPGIPDIYQGCEFACHALTDPDNRRPPDFAARQAALAGEAAPRPLDRAKLALSARLLRLRRACPDLFLRGGYRPRPAPADVCAFDRCLGDMVLHVAVATRPDSGGPGAALPGGLIVWPPDDPPDDHGPVRIVLAASAPRKARAAVRAALDLPPRGDDREPRR